MLLCRQPRSMRAMRGRTQISTWSQRYESVDWRRGPWRLKLRYLHATLTAPHQITSTLRDTPWCLVTGFH